ncbi:MAG: hypothetical protein HY842_06355 [Bacteroidetes bacterium]|nr:hypothetical protein [Bacteroidota bacterium]
MKKFLLFGLLALVFTGAFTNDAYAQKKGKKKSSKTDEYFDDSGFANKLWYGGNFNLGFAGSGETSQFTFGLTPMVGYKLVGDLVSLGPRVGFTYNYVKGRGTDGNIHKISPLAYTFGAFARVKPFQNFFGHFEYENENTKGYYVDNFNRLVIENGEVATVKQSRNNVYLGIGYTSGSLWAYEIMLLYNVNAPENTLELPFDIRFGLTYKF